MIQKVSSDAVVALWSSTRITRAAAGSAFRKIGKAGCIPPHDRYDALVEACREVCRTVGLHVESGSLKYESLGGGKSGLEVIRKIKGAAKNDWPFLFSARVESDGDDFVVRILQTSEDAGLIHTDRGMAEDALQEQYEGYLETLSAKDLTEALVRTVKGFHATPMKSGGGSYFFPQAYANDYLSLQSDLAAHGPNLVLYGVDLHTNPQLAQHMSESIVEEVTAGLEALREQHSALTSKGGKTRSNGNKRRFDQLAEMMAKIKEYHAILKLPVKHLKEAIIETKRELGLEAFRNGVE